MSEKRFTVDYPSLGVWDNETQKVYKIKPILEEEDLVDLLNRQADQIYRLEQIVAWFTSLLPYYQNENKKE